MEHEVVEGDSELRRLLKALVGRPVWFVNAGGASGSSFSLSIGDRIARVEPLRNPTASEEFRRFHGEFTIYVWCTWRLALGQKLTSSDHAPSNTVAMLKGIEGHSITSWRLTGPCRDLELSFDDAHLDVFCDHVGPEASYPLNWEICGRNSDEVAVTVGPGVTLSVAREPISPAPPQE